MIGAVLPLVAVLLAPQEHRVWVTVVEYASCTDHHGNHIRAVLAGAPRQEHCSPGDRWGEWLLAVTYLVGALFGVAGRLSCISGPYIRNRVVYRAL